MIRTVFPYVEMSRLVHASSKSVWELLTDTYRWVEWGPSILAVQCSHRFIERGSEGRVQTAVGIWLPFVITEFDSGYYWSWHVLGVRATGHGVEPVGPGFCRLIFEVPYLAAPYALVCKIAMDRINKIVERKQ
jgi:hypothetical protein